MLRLCILLVCLCIFIAPAWQLFGYPDRFYRAFSSVVRQMPRYNSQRRGTARTVPNCCVVLCTVIFVLFSVLFVCKCVLYYCHRVATQVQLKNTSSINFFINMTVNFWNWKLTFWRQNYFLLILAHSVCKMWIIQEPNMLELWNKLHFEEEKAESIYHV